MKTLPVVMPRGGKALPTYDAIMKGDYSLVRIYYPYLDKPTGRPLPALTLAFLRYALSRDGQNAVAPVGLLPIPADQPMGPVLLRLKNDV